jgi:hypothetical protein
LLLRVYQKKGVIRRGQQIVLLWLRWLDAALQLIVLHLV